MGMLDLHKLSRALGVDQHKYTPGDVADAISAGTAKMWSDEGTIVVAQIHDYPRARVLNIWLVVGEMALAEKLMPAVYEYGREQGCDYAETLARRGWERTPAGKGWTVDHKVRIMRYELGSDNG
jgi:hypothetical protein